MFHILHTQHAFLRLMSAPELDRGGYKFNNSTTTTASDLRFSPIERGDRGDVFSPITV
jgi:hypothetical protein